MSTKRPFPLGGTQEYSEEASAPKIKTVNYSGSLDAIKVRKDQCDDHRDNSSLFLVTP